MIEVLLNQIWGGIVGTLFVGIPLGVIAVKSGACRWLWRKLTGFFQKENRLSQ